MDNDVLNLLSTLNSEEIAKVEKLIRKLASKHIDTQQQEKRRVELQPEPVARQERSALRQEIGRPVKKPRQGGKRLQESGPARKGDTKKYMRTEGFYTGLRDNVFEEMLDELAPATENDKKIDRLIKRTPPSPRKGDQREYVLCGGCGYEFLINPDTVYGKFKCNECILEGKK